ncbi:transglycosylase domain-containing protein [Corynebacterium bovis]|uniref:transglycosylase domain-containing protein n=3 Tax=Corynebacterium bovis TaxID=36808 RepID=UPI001FD0DA27|nr:transglycosylase domain-containing protein [Corynebacterium bovis]
MNTATPADGATGPSTAPGTSGATAAPRRHLPAWMTLLTAVVGAGILAAVAVLPAAAAVGWAVNSGSEMMNSNVRDMASAASVPQTTTVTDRDGKPIARLYDQRREPVPGDRISRAMKDAIVAVEDRRFYDHAGVDVRGTLRAVAANLSSGGVEQGASTLDQQYVKNYLLLIDADTDSERAAATEQSAARKLREMKMAADLDRQLSKDEILTRYLNLVSFGHGSFGVEDAARTYFGVSAADLSLPQAATLAGMVQSTSALDPFTYPEASLARRNVVLDAMADTGVAAPADVAAAKQAPLGVRETPGGAPSGCIGADDAGFFCDYTLSWLNDHGLSPDTLRRGGYTVRTTLDPAAQEAAVRATRRNADPQATGVAEATTFIHPGETTHDVVAMASSREYGLDTDRHQTVLPVTHSLQGHGAGSVFKVFVAAAALEDGMGLDTMVDVPRRVEVTGLGSGGAEGCPPATYCVENASTAYPARMPLREALAQSPNTPFITMLQKIGVPRAVDLAVKLGLRSYAEPGSDPAGGSIADRVTAENSGSFVLGPTPVNPLELSNVAATLSDDGRWCEPTPVISVTDRDGRDVPVGKNDCEQVLDPGIARALADGLGGDTAHGTAAAAARAAGWTAPMSAKTGTTETSYSAAFLGFTPGWAGAVYAYNDGGTPSPLCTSPLRQCAKGGLYGGNEPAATWFGASLPVIDRFGSPGLPPVDPRFLRQRSPEAGGLARTGTPGVHAAP